MPRIPQNSGPILPGHQRGAALMLVLVLVGLLIAMFAVVFVNDLVRQNQRQRQTAAALAQAKEALIGYAVSVDLSVPCGSPPSVNNCVRPGDLPCPDLDDNGEAEGQCGNAAGSTGQSSRLGRLPWKTLGLPDLRDGDGERLWYAVSNNFKNNQRTQCDSPSTDACLNSNSRGTITLRNMDGTRTNNGSDSTGTIAVIISPGTLLQRSGAAGPQDRSPAGTNLATNYLDIGIGEDNATFLDNDADNGFINGPIYDANGAKIVNDTVLAVKFEDLMPLLERRVAREALNCLTVYADASNGRYPWAASVGDYADGTYDDVAGLRFGRMPDTFEKTILGLISGGLLEPAVDLVCGLVAPILPPGSLCMGYGWPAAAAPSCNLARPWWTNWKEQVFYGVAEGYQPSVAITLIPLAITVPSAAACAGDCLVVNPPSAAVDKQVVVMVSGKTLAGQTRSGTGRGVIANYLEGANAIYDAAAPDNLTFSQGTATPTFNDFVLYR